MRLTTKRDLINMIMIISLCVIFITSVIIIAATNKKFTNVAQIPESKNNASLMEEIGGENMPNNNETTPQEQESLVPEDKFFAPLLAPFIDMVSWVEPTNDYSINGVPNLAKIHAEIGAKAYNLGFIRADKNEPLDKDGYIRWGWGGYYKLSEDGNDGYQYEGIKKSIQGVRDAGSEVIVSVGGQLGDAPWVITNDVDKLKEMYLEIIDAYDLTRIDLDIEETNQGFAANVSNAKAIKKVQDKTGVQVVLTIPIMPYGYTTTQKNLLRAYIGNGVNISLINNMTMCYGSEVNPGEDFAQASIRATKNANKQIMDIYKEYGINLTEAQIYKMLGATVDIGYENAANPIFTTFMTKQVAEFCKSVDLGMFSYWSLNRDTLLQPNIGVDELYEFFEASKKYL